MASEQAFKQAKVQKEPTAEECMDSTSELIETMMADPEPKFQESEFLSFLKKVRTGEYEISNNELIHHPEKANTMDFPESVTTDESISKIQEEAEEFLRKLESKEFEEQVNQELNEQEEIREEKERPNFERYFINNNDLQNAEKVAESDFTSAEKAFEEQTNDPISKVWKEMYENYDPNDPQMAEKIEKIWKESINKYDDLHDGEQLNDHWQKTHVLDDLQYLEQNSEFKFSETNPYQNHDHPLSLLKEKLLSGDNIQVALVLEAHLQKHPEDYKAWKSLGRIFQDLDQDIKSLPCFMNSLKHNPDERDTYLQLGVSCSNLFKEVNGLAFLEKWLHLSPVYLPILENLGMVNPLVSEDKLKEDNWTPEEIEEVNLNMIEKFNRVQQVAGTNDHEFLAAMAVVNFINRDYQKALDYFQLASQKDPTNYSYLNKLAATYAYLGQFEQAREHYHASLDLKPSCVRVWANLGMCYNSKVT